MARGKSRGHKGGRKQFSNPDQIKQDLAKVGWEQLGLQGWKKTVQQPRPDKAGLGKGRVRTVGVTRRDGNSSATPTRLNRTWPSTVPTLETVGVVRRGKNGSAALGQDLA